MEQLEKQLGYTFKDKDKLLLAMTHSSYITEHDMTREMCNERLEFLGDSVIELAVRESLYEKFPHEEEGKLSQIKSALVRCESLAAVAREIGIGRCLRLGKGEDMVGGRDKDSILENAFEALMGAVFADGGFEAARPVVKKFLDHRIDEAVKEHRVDDHKGRLQEKAHRKHIKKLSYKTIKATGQSHDRTFTVEVYADDRALAQGIGKSKKEAEIMAAKKAINRI